VPIVLLLGMHYKRLVLNNTSEKVKDGVIDVRRLKVLQAVVETGSVAGAAELLNYTPSAISQQMSTLERETGVQLLEKVGRGIRPTEAALLLCEHTAKVFASLKDAEDALEALRAGRTGHVRLGAFPSASASLIPGALAAFRRLHPDVDLDLVVGEPDELLASLHNGSLDIAVAILTRSGDEQDDNGLEYEHLLDDPFRVVLPRGHLRSSDDLVDLADFSNERWINVSCCPNYVAIATQDACEKAGFQPAYAIEADEYPTAQGFVAAGLGVALIPVLALGPATHPGVDVRRLKGVSPARQVWSLTRSSTVNLASVRSMLDCLQLAASEYVRDYAEDEIRL
jgi:DNA-binding transcriptional LysR family regulator